MNTDKMMIEMLAYDNETLALTVKHQREVIDALKAALRREGYSQESADALADQVLDA